MEEMAKWAGTGLQRHFVKDVLLPHFYFFAPQVYVSEVLIAFTLMLGLFSRLGAFVGTLMAFNLWLGLYRSPAEWPWTYFFLIIVQITLLVQQPSDRSLWGRLVRLYLMASPGCFGYRQNDLRSESGLLENMTASAPASAAPRCTFL
jgi:uncharacterized membrane protein YphA (DoxX/SURF4 family)